MGYSKITALSLTDLFVQQIENMILSGELAFGEQLPPARELAAKMGVSRTVVTAGLVELEKLGFVEIKARQGVYVCDYRRRGTMETLVAIMRYNGGALRQNEVRSLLETRDAMECMCMRLVVERSDTASLGSARAGFWRASAPRATATRPRRTFSFSTTNSRCSPATCSCRFYTTPSARRACISGRSTASAAAYRKCMNRSSRSIPPF